MPTSGSVTSRHFELTFPSPSRCSVPQPQTTPRALTPRVAPLQGPNGRLRKGTCPYPAGSWGFVSPASCTRASPASPLHHVQQKAAGSETVFVPVRVCADRILIHNTALPTAARCICKRNSAGYSACRAQPSPGYLCIIQTSIAIGLVTAPRSALGLSLSCPCPRRRGAVSGPFLRFPMPGTALRLRFVARPNPPALGRASEEGFAAG